MSVLIISAKFYKKFAERHTLFPHNSRCNSQFLPRLYPIP